MRIRCWRLSGALLILGLASAAIGCGSSQPTVSTSPPAEATAEATDPATTTTTAESVGSATNTVSGTFADQGGDMASFTFGAGEPTPLSGLSDEVATACNQEIGSLGQSVSRAIAIPLEVTAVLTSSERAAMSANLTNLSYIEPEHRELESLGDVSNMQTLWALAYTNTPAQCATGEGASGDMGMGPARVTWNAEDVTPHRPLTWKAWLILLNAITPDDPAGTDVVDRVLLQPAVSVGGESTGSGFLAPSSGSSGWVRCAAYEPAHSPAGYLAIDPAVAKKYGCSQAP